MAAASAHSKGFTLIEVLVVVAVVALLTMVAYPSFVSHLIRTDRADAKEALAAVQLAQEKYRARHAEYAGADELEEDLRGWGWSGTVSKKELYDIAITAADRDGFTATATARTGTRQVRDRALCRTLSLTVTPAGIFRAEEECW